MSKTVLLDSNIIIYTGLPQYAELRNWLRTNHIAVSAISRLEVLGYHKLVAKDRTYFQNLFNQFDLFEINAEIIDSAILFRQQKSMSLGDAIIAATAKVYNLLLVTANTKDFNHLEELELLNPLEKY
ncbi:type II toxin-antitoxin system VapC family toxin [Sinomicrobium soli]|uniref:type II toxin-antitoxin system VapC family toxin n=1 Tax=Sinomicrobium sp. N-1-3-6 TaxID=2219864 RepID=UPI000DCC82D8|nr:type II toxin-antitoxin system VapC family toxin [Sinomicrobium sp. N-1-3-6]RAV27561.1 PIN domain nuclease [Sinomicrobium sp. N-1-3-6]